MRPSTQNIHFYSKLSNLKHHRLVLRQVSVLPHALALLLGLLLQLAQVVQRVDGGALPRLQLARHHRQTLAHNVRVDALLQAVRHRRVQQRDVQGALGRDVVHVGHELPVEGLLAQEADGVGQVLGRRDGELDERQHRVHGLCLELLHGELRLVERAQPRPRQHLRVAVVDVHDLRLLLLAVVAPDAGAVPLVVLGELRRDEVAGLGRTGQRSGVGLVQVERAERVHQLRQRARARPDLLQLQVAAARVDVRDHHVAVVLAALRGLVAISSAGAVGGHRLAVLILGLLLARVPVVPQALARLLGLALRREQLRRVAGLLGGVLVNGRQALLEQDLGKVLPVHVEGADEPADLVDGLDVDLDVSLQDPPVRQLEGLLTKRLGLLPGVAGDPGRPDAGQDERQLRVLLGHQDDKAGAGLDKVDDGGHALPPLQDGHLQLGLLQALRVVLVLLDLGRLVRPHAPAFLLGRLLGRQQRVVVRGPVLVVLAVADDGSVPGLDEGEGDVGVAVDDRGDLPLLVALRRGLLAVNGDLDVLADDLLAQELLGVRREGRLLGVGRLGLPHAAQADLLLHRARLVAHEDGVRVEDPADDVVGLRGPASRALGGGHMAREQPLAGVLGGLLRLPEGGHLGAQHGGVVVVAARQTGLEQEPGDVAVGVHGGADQLALRRDAQQ